MAPEKRVWATQIIEFLGLILDMLLYNCPNPIG